MIDDRSHEPAARRAPTRAGLGAFPLALVLTMLVAGGLPDLRSLEFAGLPASTGHPGEGFPGFRHNAPEVARVVVQRTRGVRPRAELASIAAKCGARGADAFGACGGIPADPHASLRYLARESLIALPPPVA
ncbi:MAG: hypothetical protein RBS39_14075 [Phycisphaerales bacterium]|nr:hypothetical protein [Phycisphaerales bacterium]